MEFLLVQYGVLNCHKSAMTCVVLDTVTRDFDNFQAQTPFAEYLEIDLGLDLLNFCGSWDSLFTLHSPFQPAKH